MPRSDTNQAEIVRALRSIGAVVRVLSPYRQAGFDLLVGYRGRWHVMEVKRVIKHKRIPDSVESLTVREAAFRMECQGRAPYTIVYDMRQAIDIITKQPGAE
jgi:hypothetical protein